MSTPGLIKFTANGVTKVAYIHWDGDSYSTDIRSWLKAARDGGLKEAITNLKVVNDFGDGATIPTRDQEVQLAKYTDTKVGGPDERWYRLLRLCQGDPHLVLESGYVYDGSEYSADYEYHIDADARIYQEKRNGRRRAKVLWEDL